MLTRILVLAIAFASVPAIAAAQAAPAPGPIDPIGIGAAYALSLPGRIAEMRISAPASPRVGLDIAVGHVNGQGDTRSGADGLVFGAQLRWHWHGRRTDGHSGYWLGGPLLMQMTDRTEIRWPGGVTTTIVERTIRTTLQVGYGWDWLSKRGTRAGIELSTGGDEGGPVPMVKTFLVWGPGRR